MYSCIVANSKPRMSNNPVRLKNSPRNREGDVRLLQELMYRVSGKGRLDEASAAGIYMQQAFIE